MLGLGHRFLHNARSVPDDAGQRADPRSSLVRSRLRLDEKMCGCGELSLDHTERESKE